MFMPSSSVVSSALVPLPKQEVHHKSTISTLKNTPIKFHLWGRKITKEKGSPHFQLYQKSDVGSSGQNVCGSLRTQVWGGFTEADNDVLVDFHQVSLAGDSS